MSYRVRVGILLGLLALSLGAFWQRAPIRRWLSGEAAQAARMQGSPAPELPNVPSLEGPRVRLADLRGRVVLLHFFTFGCSNCEHMIARYSEWDRRLAPRGLSVVGVHAPETPREADVARLRVYAAAHAIRWPVVLDTAFEAMDRYRAPGWPTVVLIDRAGAIRGFFVGDNRAADIEAALQGLLRG